MTCTVVSLFPREINENKSGQTPDRFLIAAAEKDDISILHVEDGYSTIYLDETRGALPVVILAEDVAKSIVNDFVGSFQGIGPNTKPGMFYVSGKYTKEEIKKQFPDKVKLAATQQRVWGMELVRLADDDWQKYHRLKSINELPRYFAELFGLKRDWLALVPEEEVKEELIRCKFCAETIPAVAIVCPNCKNILDSKKYEELKGK
jgi:hypothetical protein